MEKECRFCHKKIKYTNWRTFASHCGNCKANPNYYARLIKISMKKRISRKLIIKKCKKCKKIFKQKLIKSDYNKMFCSRKCANSQPHSKEWNKKIGNARRIHKLIKFICPICGKEKMVGENKIPVVCSRKCVYKKRTNESLLNKDKKHNYYIESAFRFNVYKFPGEFNLNLLKRHGWYHHIKNRNGIDRDHLIPVTWGFKNSINPKTISHPANCQLIRHKENQQKGTKCHLTIDKLLIKINEWNKKYKINEVSLKDDNLKE